MACGQRGFCSLCRRAPCDLLRGATAPTARTANEQQRSQGKKLMAGRFVRYMDDAAIIVSNKTDGLQLKEEICAFVATEMRQQIGKWSLVPVKRGFTFCGFRIRRKFKLIKRQSMIRSAGSYR